MGTVTGWDKHSGLEEAIGICVSRTDILETPETLG